MTDTDATSVTLRRLVELMRHMRDEETFRWFQDSRVASDGSVQADGTYYVTMGQVRRELGIDTRTVPNKTSEP